VVGIPFFITLILSDGRPLVLPASLAMLLVPFAAASSYWAFFSHKASMGVIFFLVAALPMLVSVILSFLRAGE